MRSAPSSQAPWIVFKDDGLWLASVPTRYGVMEMRCGEGDAPDCAALLLVEKFLGDAVDHIAVIRRSVFRVPVSWRPIRFAVNDRGQLGLQFKYCITGAQQGVFFADQHSTYKVLATEIEVSLEDAARLAGPFSGAGRGA